MILVLRADHNPSLLSNLLPLRRRQDLRLVVIFPVPPRPFIVMAEHSPLSDMVNKDALLRAQIDRLETTLDEEFVL